MNDTYSFAEFPPNIPFRVQFHRITTFPKHWHSTTELLFVLKGTVTAEVRGELSSLSDGDLLLINANQVHELRSSSSCHALSVQLDLHKFDLPREEADRLYFVCDSSRDPDKSRYDNLRTLIALIVERNANQDAATLYDNKSFAYSMLKELTWSFQAQRPGDETGRDKYLDRMTEIVSYIDSHYRETLKLSQLAEAMHLSPPYLSSLFPRCLGATFSEYYNSVRLGYAVSDLVTGDESIDTIALKHGYANAQAFSRAFKAKYNTLPSLYRKGHRELSHSGMGPDRRTSYLNYDVAGSAFDISALAQYLPRRSGTAAGSGPAALLTAHWNEVRGEFGGHWRKLLGVGSAKQILYREVQAQLEEIQREIGFEYIKFHGLFSDEMMVVTRTADGRLDFNFKTIDMVFDYLFSIRLKPVIQLSFMPIELAKDRGKMIFNNSYNTSQPARLEEWTELVRAFFTHIMDRYGLPAVEELPVLLWNNADSSVEMFGMQEDLAFFRLYQETYQTIKEMDPNIRMGAPAMTFMHQESVAWARRFFQWELDHGIRPDFFCSQYYAVIWQTSQLRAQMKIDLHSWQPDHLVATEPAAHFPLMAGIPLSTDPNQLRKHRKFLDSFQAEMGLEQLPTWITEWNLSVSHNNLISDTLFGGCYVLKNVLEHSEGLEAMGYWSATDFIEEQPLVMERFHGGLGLMTVDGVRKPQFLAFQLLRLLRPKRLAQGEGYIVTRSEHTVTMLLYNYEHYSDIYASNKTYNVNATTRYTPFTEQKQRRFHIRLDGLPARPVLEGVEFIVNRENGSAYDDWIRMGAPSGGANLVLDRYRLDYLKGAAHPLVHTIQPVIQNGVLEYEALLEPLEFRMLQIKFR